VIYNLFVKMVALIREYWWLNFSLKKNTKDQLVMVNYEKDMESVIITLVVIVAISFLST